MTGVPWVAMGLPPPPPPVPMPMPPPPASAAHGSQQHGGGGGEATGGGGGTPDPVLALFEVLSDPGVDAAVCRRTLQRLGSHAGRLLTASGDSLLHHAARAGRIDLVRLLVEPTGGEGPAVDAAARADLLSWRNNEGHTALHAALAAEQEACCLVLVHAGGAEARKAPTGTAEGVPPIVMAAAVGLPVVVRALLAYGIGLDTRDARGWTPLHAASAAGQVAVVDWLVSERGADVRAKDEQGRRPHDLALKHGHSDVFAMLHAWLTGHGAGGAARGGAAKAGAGAGQTAAAAEERKRQKRREKRLRKKAQAKAATALEQEVVAAGGMQLRPNVEEEDEEGEEEEGEDAATVGDRIVLRARAFSQERDISALGAAGAFDDDHDTAGGGLDDSISLSLSSASASAATSAPGSPDAAETEAAIAVAVAVGVGAAAEGAVVTEAPAVSRLFGRWRPEAREEEEEEEGERGDVGLSSASSPLGARAPARVMEAGGHGGGRDGSDGEEVEEEASLEALLRARAPGTYVCMYVC